MNITNVTCSAGMGPPDASKRKERNMKATGQPFRIYLVIGLLVFAMILGTFTLTGFAQTPTVGMGPSGAQSRQLPGSFTLTGSMTTARKGHTATLQPDGRVLIVGGNSGVASAELYDPLTGTFSATGSLGRALVNHRATLLPDGRTLITDASGHAELYNSHTGTFTATGNMIAARADHTATLLLSGKVLVTGSSSVAELYDPLTGTFTATGSTTDTSIAAAILLLDGRVLRTGFYDTEIYDPATSTFRVVGPSLSIFYGGFRQDFTSTLLPSGSVLFTGGWNPLNCETVAFPVSELYVPENGAFQPTGSLNTTRALHSATLLPSGAVLIAGGFSQFLPQDPRVDNRSTEIYITDRGTFLPESSMIYARSAHTATLLKDGRVLIAGGGSAAAQTSAELYSFGGATLTASPTSLPAGGNLTAAWEGISSPSSTDWIGLYQPGAANSAYIDWIYVSCSKTPGGPQASGSCPFNLPSNLTPGTYQLRLLGNDRLNDLATSNNFTVTGGGGGPALTASPTSIAIGGTLLAAWSGISSPSSTDWIGLYQPSAANTAFIDWIYVSCSKTANSPRASGSCPLVLPSNLLPGTYELRLLANNSASALATSNTFTVQ
jgi:hypothetical protein